MNTPEMKTDSFNLLSVVVPVATERGPFDNLIKWLPVGLSMGIQIVVVLDRTKNILDAELMDMLNQNRSERLIVVEGRYGSPGLARNAGIKLATAKWLMFWDCDDYPEIDNCLRLVSEATEAGAEFAIGGFSWGSVKAGTPSKNHYLSDNPAKLLQSIGRNPGIWRFAWKRNSLKSDFSNLQMAEDQVFILSNCNFEAKYLVGDSLVYTYLSGGGTQQTANRRFMQDLSPSMLATSKHISIATGTANSLLACTFLVRQFLSAIKHGIVKTRFLVLLTFLGILKTVGWRDSVQILQIFIRTLNNLATQDRDVTIALTGGLGNQLFQLAVALDVAGINKVHLETSIGKPRLNKFGKPEIASFNLPMGVKLLESRKAGYLLRKSSGFMLRSGVTPRSLETSRFMSAVLKSCWQLIVQLSLKKKITPIAGKGVGYFEIEPAPGNLFLHGYFQSFRWADSVYERLMLLTPSFGGSEIDRFSELAILEKPLVVHIRLGDYKNEPNFGLASKAFYEISVKTLWESNKFKKIWVFSDEPELAGSYFPEEFSPHLRWIPEILGSSALTLEVMRLGRGYVIGNSTYSWWGAYLSRSKNPPVIAPDPWFRNLADPIDLVPSRWRRVKYSVTEND
jgi:hypothetical protein